MCTSRPPCIPTELRPTDWRCEIRRLWMDRATTNASTPMMMPISVSPWSMVMVEVPLGKDESHSESRLRDYTTQLTPSNHLAHDASSLVASAPLTQRRSRPGSAEKRKRLLLGASHSA